MLKNLMHWSPMHLQSGDGSIFLLTRCREKQKYRQKLFIIFYNHNLTHTHAHTHTNTHTHRHTDALILSTVKQLDTDVLPQLNGQRANRCLSLGSVRGEEGEKRWQERKERTGGRKERIE